MPDQNQPDVSLEEFLISAIAEFEGQGASLRELLLAAHERHFSERETRHVLRQMERDDAVYADWDWKYHTYNPAEATG